MRIDGRTELIAHLGYPAHSFKAPLIYNPYFAAAGINALVVPMACRAESFARVLKDFFELENARGALVTMPHKVSVVALLDEASTAVQVSGACNAVKRLADGRLAGDQFDGEGFVRGVQSKGFVVAGARCLVVGCGGVGRPIAASLAQAGAKEIALFDVSDAATADLASRLRTHFRGLNVTIGRTDPAGFDLVANATPLGMNEGDALPVDPARLDARTFAGDVVMRQPVTPFLAAAKEHGCRIQVGTDMLFEMIPPYLEFFGLPVATPERLRELAQLEA
ncbi:MAG TPA: ThiF family adenylyltransferase [Ramlibacter sp.]|nr:ThiF family adenylyltransferase [Ramlibacter sp.]